MCPSIVRCAHDPLRGFVVTEDIHLLQLNMKKANDSGKPFVDSTDDEITVAVVEGIRKQQPATCLP